MKHMHIMVQEAFTDLCIIQACCYSISIAADCIVVTIEDHEPLNLKKKNTNRLRITHGQDDDEM